MDLSDGSDGEGDYELDENALLGSDDEDAGIVQSRYSKFGESSANPQGFEDEEHTVAEDGDVLDLELNEDDGLEFADESSIHPSNSEKVAPVRIVTISNASDIRNSVVAPNTDGYQHQMPENYEDYTNDYEDSGRFDEDDDDDDDRNTRTRFHSERNTEDMITSSQQIKPNSFPIQTLGSGKQATPADNHNNNQRNWGRNTNHGQQHHQPSQFPRPRFQGVRNSLLGDRPRGNQNFNQFHRPRGIGLRMDGLGLRPPISQFPGGRGFTGYNQPPRIPNPHCPPQIMEHGPQHPFPNQAPPRPRMQGPPPPNMLNTQGMGQNNSRLPMQMRQPRPIIRPRGGGTNMSRPHMPPNQWRNQRLPQGQNQFPRMPMNPALLGQPNINNNNNMNYMPGPPGPNMFSPQEAHLFMEQGLTRPEMPPPQMPGVQFNPFTGQPIQPFPQPQHGFPGGQHQGQHSLVNPPHEMYPHNNNNAPQHQNPFFQQPLQQQQQPPREHAQYIQPLNRWEPQANSWPAAPPHGPPMPSNYNLPAHMGSNPNQNNDDFVHQQQQLQMVDHNLHSGGTRTDETQIYRRNELPHDNYQREHSSSELDSRAHGQKQQDRHTSRSDHDRKSETSSYDRRSYADRNEYSRNHDRYPIKRKYDEESPHRSSDKLPKSRSERLPSPPTTDPKTDELLKIREEAKKTIGLDDEYIRKLEAQAKLREEILRKKAASRKKLTGSDEPDTVTAQHDTIRQKPSSRSSIYINPKAFTGDLNPLDGAESESTKSMHLYTNSAGITTKPRKVLKIVKDKYGNIISKSKVIVVPKQHQDARTTSA